MSANSVLSSGFQMPNVGYGCGQKLDGFADAVELALEAGYRHFDTAWLYGTEKILGDVIKSWIDQKKIKREELFITTKLPAKGMRPDGVKKYLRKSLENLQLDYVDLYLIHAPFGVCDDDNDESFPIENDKIILDKTTDLIAIWKAMEKAVEQNQIKSIGLSNFNVKQIQRIQTIAKIPPANLQIEMHVYNQQKDLVDFCKKHNIIVSAYSPLSSLGAEEFLKQRGQTRAVPNPLKENAVIEIAQKYRKTEAQILLRHLLQKGGVAVISKSATPKRIRENVDVFDFCLDGDDVKTLDALDMGAKGRVFNFLFLKGVEEHPEYPF